MAKKTPFISVIVHTRNSESTLRKALQSVQSFADEIIVMDMKSIDRSVKIAESFNCKIYSHPDLGYVEPARNAAIEKASGEWIFILDADEEAPAKMNEVVEKLHNTKTDVFFVPRMNIIWGRMVKSGWWPDYIIRLFRKSHVTWNNTLHSLPNVTGTTEYLPEKEEFAITHHNYPNIESFITRAQNYASIEAKEELKTQRVINPHQAFFSEFVRRYYAWKGNQDKTHGVFLSYFQGYQKILEEAFLWELRGYPEASREKFSQVLKKTLSEAKYWEAHQQWEKSHGLEKLYWAIRRKYRL